MSADSENTVPPWGSGQTQRVGNFAQTVPRTELIEIWFVFICINRELGPVPRFPYGWVEDWVTFCAQGCPPVAHGHSTRIIVPTHCARGHNSCDTQLRPAVEIAREVVY